MQIIIHRGTHQIGGVATEIHTASTRILIDMGNELSLNEKDILTPLSIPGVTDTNGHCDAVLFTHNHGDHVGQLRNILEGIPMYMGSFAKDLLYATTLKADVYLKFRIAQVKTFMPGICFQIGNISITPFLVDHSACDSYMFLVEADGKRILHTGDFRTHGFRGKAVAKTLDKIIRKVDVLIIEGTTLSRNATQIITENELQRRITNYMRQYKYVFVLCAATNLERICALSKAVPKGKYFICDEYQDKLLELMQKHWGAYSALYRDIKKIRYGENLLPRFRERGFLMVVRDNQKFREIMRKFDANQSIILYSLWDGYRTKEGSRLPEFLNSTRHWESFHTSGHASQKDILVVIEKTSPDAIIPIHTDKPEMLQKICQNLNIVLLEDGEEYYV